MKYTQHILLVFLIGLIIAVVIFKNPQQQASSQSGIRVGTVSISETSEKGETTKDELVSDIPPERVSEKISEILKARGNIKEIDGGLWFNTSIGLPPCDDTARGLLWFSSSKEGSDDQILICMKNALDIYNWQGFLFETTVQPL